MMPHLPLSSDRVPVDVPSPPRFRAPLGEIRNVSFRTGYLPASGDTSAQKAGLRYEERVHEALTQALGKRYFRTPHVHFSDDRGSRTCVPDALVVSDSGKHILIEVKYSHMPEAWWQLRRLYQPVLQTILPQVLVLEICRTFDPDMPFPERVELVDGVLEWDKVGTPEKFGVYQWRL